MGDRSHVRWVPWVLALLVSTFVGIAAYNAGLAHGIVVPPQAGSTVFVGHPYFWFHPFGFVFPLFFFMFWFVVARGLFWRGARGYRCHDGGYGVPPRFEEWHARMHERMKTTPDDSRSPDVR